MIQSGSRRRRPRIPRRRAHSRVPSWVRATLGVPLEIKLLGANLIILGVAVLALFGPVPLRPGRLTDVYVVIAALIVGALVNFALVKVALRPINALERVAKRVSEGRLSERVPVSMLADRELTQLSSTVNEMLDSLAAGRERMRKLGAEVVYAEERERAQVARELHDSVGQTLAAASFQIAAAAHEIGIAPCRARARDRSRAAAHIASRKSATSPARCIRVLRPIWACRALSKRWVTQRGSARWSMYSVNVDISGVVIPPAVVRHAVPGGAGSASQRREARRRRSRHGFASRPARLR